MRLTVYLCSASHTQSSYGHTANKALSNREAEKKNGGGGGFNRIIIINTK